MKRSRIFFTLCYLALIIGVIATSIPWGDPAGFHGQGFPAPAVMWEDGSDFPNPYAIILNPIIYWILFLTIWGAIEGVLFLIHRARRHSQAK